MEYKNKFKYFYWGPCVTKFHLDDDFCKGLIEKGKLLNTKSKYLDSK